MPKEKLTNEQKFLKEMQKIMRTKLDKYGLKHALLLLSDNDGNFKLNLKKQMTQEQFDAIPRV